MENKDKITKLFFLKIFALYLIIVLGFANKSHWFEILEKDKTLINTASLQFSDKTFFVQSKN